MAGSGDIALGGVFQGTVGFGGEPLSVPAGSFQTAFVTRLDGNGDNVFSVALDGDHATVAALAFDDRGDLLVGGTNYGSLTLGGGTFVSGGNAGFVARLDPTGAPRWAFQLGGYADVLALAADAEGNVLVGGRFQSLVQAGNLQGEAMYPSEATGFVLQVGPDGTPAWLKVLPTAPVNAIAVRDGGEVLVTGSYVGGADFGGGPLPYGAGYEGIPFVARFDGHGELTGTSSFAAPLNPLGDRTAVGGAGTALGIAGADVVTAGWFGGPLQIGATQLHSSALADLFVARLPL